MVLFDPLPWTRVYIHPHTHTLTVDLNIVASPTLGRGYSATIPWITGF